MSWCHDMLVYGFIGHGQVGDGDDAMMLTN